MSFIVILLVFTGMVLVNHSSSSNFDPAITQTVGAFIGGVVPVFVSIGTVLLIYMTYMSNRDEFEGLNKTNKFQQFNTTFDSMCETLRNGGKIYKDNGVIDNFTNLYTSVVKEVIEGDYCKGLHTVDDYPETGFSDAKRLILKHKINDGDLDNELIKVIKSKRIQKNQNELKLLANTIISLFEFLEDSKNLFDDNYKIDYFLLRVRYILGMNNFQLVLLFYSLHNDELFHLIKDNDLLSGYTHPLSHQYLAYTREGETFFYYNFDLMHHYKKGKFNEI